LNVEQGLAILERNKRDERNERDERDERGLSVLLRVPPRSGLANGDFRTNRTCLPMPYIGVRQVLLLLVSRTPTMRISNTKICAICEICGQKSCTLKKHPLSLPRSHSQGVRPRGFMENIEQRHDEYFAVEKPVA